MFYNIFCVTVCKITKISYTLQLYTPFYQKSITFLSIGIEKHKKMNDFDDRFSKMMYIFEIN